MGDYITARQIEGDLNVVLDSVVDNAILALDPTERVAIWNRGAGRLKGFRADQVVGRNFSIFSTAGVIALGEPALALEVAANAWRLRDEGWRVRRDGSSSWADLAITPLRDLTGRSRGFVTFTREGSDSREAAVTLQALQADLISRSAHVSCMWLACSMREASPCN